MARPPAAAVFALSALGFAAMAALIKLVSGHIGGEEVAFLRFSIGLVFCGLAHLRKPLRARDRLGLVLRGLFGGSAVLAYFLSIEHLQVGVATLLNYTSPVFTTLWAAIFLREHPTKGTVAALALALVGVGLLVAGQAPPSTASLLDRWLLVGLLGSVLSGAAVATIRAVRRTDGAWEIFTAFNAGGALLTALPAARRWVWPSPGEWEILVAIGLLSVVAQLGITWSLRWLRAAVGGLLLQITPVAALALGALAFGDRIQPLAWAGVALTLFGISLGAALASRGRPSQVMVEEG